MGRWNYGIYDSDTSLDYLAVIHKFLMKETVYCFSPEQVFANTYWLQEALTLVEIMLILAEEDHDGAQSHLMDQHNAVRRWRDVFFNVWDADWNDPSNHSLPYRDYVYRVEHRSTILMMFDRLIELADYWQADLLQRDIPPFVLREKLPLFSLVRLRGRDGQDMLYTGRFLDDFIEMLRCHIVFLFSEENREKDWGFDFSDLDEAWVDIDLLALMCQKYETSPGLRPPTIHRWLDMSLGLWSRYIDHPERPVSVDTLPEYEGILYTNTVTVFVRLIDVAQRYSRGWGL